MCVNIIYINIHFLCVFPKYKPFSLNNVTYMMFGTE